MAKPTWATVSPTSGSGNGNVSVGASVHTGRTQRSGNATFKASGVSDVVRTITQLAETEFVNIENVSAPKAGGNVTINGVSNSSKLTFSLGTGTITISLPGSYTAGGASTTNGAAIAGDPGASAAFNFSITVNVPANATTGAISKIIIVTTNGGQTASATITQAAGDSVLTVSPSSITINPDGTAVTVTVTSNTNWTVE